VRILELFCGIGGCAAALREAPRARVVAAVDQNRRALAVYARNFGHPVLPNAIESLPERWWRASHADVWWMSPPCPPYTRRGARRDLDDPRARSLITVIDRIADLRPQYVALENVGGFEGSRAHQRLHGTLDRAGYTVRETRLCPTELGLPNRRPRFYLVAGRGVVREWPVRAGERVAVADLLDEAADAALWCEPALERRYAGALDEVEAADDTASTACFTSAYGRSPIRSGSYLRTPAGLRRFSPAEILRLLDFPRDFTLPPHMPLRSAWPLVGNSISVRAVRWVLGAVPGLLEPRAIP
jgi:DNA (cytosine-5)-methyltransferase 1